MTTHSFTVYVDEKSHLLITAEVREYVPSHGGVWCVAAACRCWRGQYESEGQYSRTTPLDDEFMVVARAATIDEALKALVRTALTQAKGPE